MNDTDRQNLIIGVGGGGCSIVGHLASQVAEDVVTLAVDSDACALAESAASLRVQVGDELLSGFGAGGDAEKGRLAAESSAAEILAAAESPRLVVVVAGAGGGVGGGGAPVVVQEFKAAGALVVAFIVTPFKFEGRQRAAAAARAVEQMDEVSDITIVASADDLMDQPDDALPDAFKRAADVLGGAVLSLFHALTSPGYIRLDYSDFRRIASDTHGPCRFAFADASGDDRATRVVDQLRSATLPDGGDLLATSRLLLMTVVGGPDLTLKEVGELMETVDGTVRPECRLTLGTSIVDTWAGRLSAVAIAGEKREVKPSPGLVTEPASSKDTVTPPDEAEPATPIVPPPRGRSRRGRARQARLPLEAAGRGRFKDVEPTILNGEDFDVPTFVRRGIKIDR